jgi:hypothetical protein
MEPMRYGGLWLIGLDIGEDVARLRGGPPVAAENLIQPVNRLPVR